MSAFDDLLGIMQTEGEKNNPKGIQIGKMTGENTCEIDNLSLEPEDLLFAEHLVHPVATKVMIHEDGTDASEYLEPLQAGDLVAVQNISDSLYVVLGKLVSI